MKISKELDHVIGMALAIAKQRGYEYITPEIFLLALCQDYVFCSVFERCGGDLEMLVENLLAYADEYLAIDHGDFTSEEVDESDFSEKEEPNEEADTTFAFSESMQEALIRAQYQAKASGKDCMELIHLIYGIWNLKESYAVYYLESQGIERNDFIECMIDLLDMSDYMDDEEIDQEDGVSGENGDAYDGSEEMEEDFSSESAMDGKAEKSASSKKTIREYATCLNEMLDRVNPLIGREAEMERTIQILCRKDKNNPLHIGEPGVGKTAIAYGLARRIEEGQVPDALKGAKIYSLELGSLLAGTQYRGDLEKRMKKLLTSISKEKNPIIYLDEIHNLAGAGAVGESSFDISNFLKPYLAEGHIRFIGATTYEEYKKHFEKNKSLVRRFQNVDIAEPSKEEAIAILNGLKEKYEEFHGVVYEEGLLSYAVEMSAKYMNERFLPDKAIDLIDEAGAYRKIHPLDQEIQIVGRDVIREILSNICKVTIDSVQDEQNEDLSSLEERMLSKVFGQDEAVSQVVNAIKFSRAGLLEDGKPLSSFLFAGPTGVGKTEIAKTLASELGIKLIRFDMSEYGEKHAVAKLIGSPAGYVGYEEGGLLTEAIRKNPSCVLLLDEIEKAHADIYNVLLQMMDYATLTDNQGRKADFRNVIIIMTSNAGASQIGKSGIGFKPLQITSDIVSEEVKRIFQPEFRNRLNAIVIFKGMNDAMATKIAGKKFFEFAALLESKQVTLSYTEAAVRLLKEKGTSAEFGARQIDRILQNEVKPLLVDELLFGSLRNGGACRIDVRDDQFFLSE